MRLHLLAALAVTSFGVAFASIACSDKAPAAAAEGVDSGGPAPTNTEEEETPPASSSELPNKDSGPTTTDDSGGGGNEDASQNTTGDAGSRCEANSIRESGDNNTPAGANAVTASGTPSFCGSTAAGDPDHIKFVMPQNLPGGWCFAPSSTGNGVDVQISIAGGAFQDPSGSIPFQGGAEYVLKITPNNGASDYRVNFNFTNGNGCQ